MIKANDPTLVSWLQVPYDSDFPIQKQIQKEVARGGSNSATKVFGKALDFVGKANSAVENATRLATYATLRERGYTPKQSAYAARNITVNFTRKGTAGPLLNSFYL